MNMLDFILALTKLDCYVEFLPPDPILGGLRVRVRYLLSPFGDKEWNLTLNGIRFNNLSLLSGQLEKMEYMIRQSMEAHKGNVS